jgi:hypothetical protein
MRQYAVSPRLSRKKAAAVGVISRHGYSCDHYIGALSVVSFLYVVLPS